MSRLWLSQLTASKQRRRRRRGTASDAVQFKVALRPSSVVVQAVPCQQLLLDSRGLVREMHTFAACPCATLLTSAQGLSIAPVPMGMR
jgi:hypothetical protein